MATGGPVGGAAGGVAGGGQVVALLGDGIELRFFTSGRGPLAGLCRTATGHEYVDFAGLPAAREGTLWELAYAGLPGGPERVVTNNDLPFSGWDRRSLAGHAAITGRWRLDDGAGHPGMVEMTVALSPGEARWSLRCARAGRRGAGTLQRVQFPLLRGLGRSATRRQAASLPDELVVPRMAGRAYRDTPATLFGDSALGHRLAAPYPGGFTAQCATYQDGDDGLLLATLDPSGSYKQFALEAEADHSRFAYRAGYLVPLPPDGTPLPDDCGLPYDALVAVYAGDWQRGAGRYRQWAIEQPWCAAGPLARREGRPPAWLRQNALWAWNRGRSPDVAPPVADLRGRLDLPVALDWYWWHRTPYDTNFPDFLPPREGEASFRAAVDALHAAGVRAVVYINGRLCGLESDAWTRDGASAFAARDAAGAHGAEVYNRFNRAALAPMCPATSFWQDRLAGIVAELAGRYDLDGIYVDQVGMAPPRPCYDRSHGHPLGGGSYWFEGNRQAVARMRQCLARADSQALLTESCTELYLGVFDGFVVLDNSMEKFGAYRATGEQCRPVPLLPAIYHDYALTLGSYASLTDPPYDDLWPVEFRPKAPLRLQDERWRPQFRVELARTVTYGNQPMLANFQPDHARLRGDDVAFVLRLARLYDAARPFLLYGRRLPEPRVEAPSGEVEFWGKSVYTLPGADQVFVRTLPAVFASAWEAPDGTHAIVAVNATDRSVRCALRPVGLEHPPGDGAPLTCWQDGQEQRLSWPAAGPVHLDLPAGGTAVLRWAPPPAG